MLNYSGNENDDILSYLNNNGKNLVAEFCLELIILFFTILIILINNFYKNDMLSILNVIECLWDSFQISVILGTSLTAIRMFYHIYIIKKYYKGINKMDSRKKIFKIIK